MKKMDNIVQLVDYFEDVQGSNTAFLVLTHAGNTDLENLITNS